jgi:2-methylcitrate dehydratase PrpD
MSRVGDGAQKNLSGVLGDFVASSRWEDIGPELRHEAKRSLLNCFGGALGVARDPAVSTALAVLQRFAGRSEATVIGREERLDLLSASFVNAVGANLLDYDDTHLRTVIHPTAPVAPPVLALAEQHGSSGAEVLHAFVLGAEVECRLGNAVSPGHYARGWHITATCGVFGAAAASAKLLGLDAARTAHALGIAASQSAGLVENLPSAAKNVGVGNAARNGLFAALLAEAGYEAAPGAIDGALGWARAAGDVPDRAEVTNGLGEEWEFAKNTYKPYPCGIVMHSVVDACLELRETHRLAAADIRAVTVKGSSLLLERGDRAVRNERDARVSIHHCAAVAFLSGAAGIDEFSIASVMHPAARDFRAKVRAELDASLPVGAAAVTVETVDGTIHANTVIHARGSFERPMTEADIEAKVRALAQRGMPSCEIEKLITEVWRLEAAPGIQELMRLARP